MYNYYLLCIWIYYTNIKYMIMRLTDVCTSVLSVLIIISSILMNKCKTASLKVGTIFK